MNKYDTFPILCVLFLVVRNNLCNGDSKDVSASIPSRPEGFGEVSDGDLFKFIWQNVKRRRSVQSVDYTKTNSRFECGDHVLALFLNHADVTKIRIYGPLGDQLNLGQLAAFCGVSVKTTHTDVRLHFSYDSCYVKQEAAEYLLFLSWYGTDTTLSCPVSVTPPSVICKKNAMQLTVAGEGTAGELFVALNGEWAPLLYVATQCWHRESSNLGELSFLVPYTSCGVNFRDGHFVLDVRSQDKLMPLFCPCEPASVFPVRDSRFPSVHPQPRVYHKEPTEFFTAPASEINPVEGFDQQERNAAKPSSPFLQPRSSWKPKIPVSSLLPGAFNLAVNFPFSVPIPTRHAPVPHRHHFAREPEFPTEAPTPESIQNPTPEPDPTPAPTASSSQEHQDLVPGVQTWQELLVSNEQLAAAVTKAPKPYPYMQFPYFQKPSALSHTEPEHQHASVLVPGTAQYHPFESTHNNHRPHHHQVSDVLSSLAQYLPPGYFICSYNNPQPHVLPQKFPVLQPAQPFRYQPYHYQSAYGYQSSTTAPPYPASPLIPLNLQSQARPYPSYPSFQSARPLQPHHYPKPTGQIQPGPTTPVKVSLQELRPLTQTSSHAPQYFHYQRGGDQYLDHSRGFGTHAAGTQTSSHLPNQQSQTPKIPYPHLRPEVLTDVTGFTPPKRFFHPRSFASASLQLSDVEDNGPLESAPPTPKSPAPPLVFPVKGNAQVAQLPYSQGPSFRYVQNPMAHFQKSSEPDDQKPQNDTVPQSYRQSGAEERVQPHRKASFSGSYFYRPPGADTRK